ncbi:probable two component sensor histidine kinase transcription regulator protein [Pseudooceanicola batsensis HTCC2597]|uniref:Probable two component sensor histidine kinase transcription regulator protein n=1 Tax=Pseudooceanicola batsensis (strain ATCC BAA-863 / DSM 15984 / KCTC 12145 / HTCC2597) TaxID=252305 RepID=A3U0X0_PSEBH|nr:two component system sensor histidine kinase [Pseudooceanicola batsensis]EAQ02411.1 probable two component sensor histidine kinase transcription regulator protein [Pseudooceanicola batsensis HTCC2597]
MNMKAIAHLKPSVYLFGLLSLASAVLIVALALAQPWIGVRLVPVEDAVVVASVQPGAPGDDLTPGARILSMRPAGAVSPGLSLVPADLIEEPDGLPTIADMEALFEKQGRLHEMLEAGPVEVAVLSHGAERSVRITAAPSRPVGDLPFTFWMQLAVGIVSGLLGGWVLSIRRGEPGARYLAVAGLGLMVASHAAALYSSRALPLSEGAFEWASAFNSAGALVFGIGMVNLFLVYPARYLPSWVPGAVTTVFGAWTLASFLRVTGTPALAIHLPTVVLMSGILLGAIGQIVATRGNPRQRAALRWFGLSVTIGAGSFVSLIALPQALGFQPKISQSHAFALFLLVYLGLALGVARYRLFDLEFWAFRALFYGGGVALLLALDAVLIYSVSLERIPAFSIALLAVAFIYLPARDVLARVLSGRRTMTSSELFDMVSSFALSSDRTMQKQRFGELLERLFQPLHIEDAPARVEAPRLLENGGVMEVPGLDGIADLRISWPHRGRRLFSARDLDQVRDILRIGAQFIERRRAYEAGALQERQRINRDMHDNVGVQLLGALHSQETLRKNALIRQALTDLREMVSNNFGGPTGLRALLADLRAEMSEYLAAADIRLEWDDEDIPDMTAAPPVVNAIRSSLREGIGNILRHSGAAVARVRISMPASAGKGWLILEIGDDGRGLPGSLESARGNGNGLRNLMSRSEAWDGDFSVSPGAEGRGTLLRLSIPLAAGAEEDTLLSDAAE